MEVSFTTHSHIIGRAGTNINTVMKETSTKIHFPDENRVAGEKKSNEVTISGELVNVETARRRIRVRIDLFLSIFFVDISGLRIQLWHSYDFVFCSSSFWFRSNMLLNVGRKCWILTVDLPWWRISPFCMGSCSAWTRKPWVPAPTVRPPSVEANMRLADWKKPSITWWSWIKI